MKPILPKNVKLCSIDTEIENLYDKARKALFKLKQYYNLRDNVNIGLKLFDSLILPILRLDMGVKSGHLTNLTDSMIPIFLIYVTKCTLNN
jgi:hypothetical protein